MVGRTQSMGCLKISSVMVLLSWYCCHGTVVMVLLSPQRSAKKFRCQTMDIFLFNKKEINVHEKKFN